MCSHLESGYAVISVVVPVHNEALNVPPLLAEIEAALAPRAAELGAFDAIVVDDLSSDDTLAVLRAQARTRPWLTVVAHRNNCGQSAALLTGVRAAKGPLIATLDGDGQNDPADIPALARRWRELQGQGAGPVLIAGWRNKRQDTALRKLSSRIANGVRSRLLGDATPDTGCGLKVFARDDFLALPWFDHLHRFMPALFRRAGGRTESVPVAHRPRTMGRSHYGVHNRLWVGLVDLCGVMWLQRRARLPVAEHISD
jgi:dolichol-phosphate mannosyltransferase